MHGVRVLVQDAHGRVLLIRHSYGSDKWMPPGGGMHRGEDPLVAAAREVLEETGCRLGDARVLQIRGEDLHGSSNAVRVVLGRTGDSPRADGREIVEAEFFTLDALPAHMSPGLAQRIREWAAQA